jgi:transglutaminase-like putative cysteine protease
VIYSVRHITTFGYEPAVRESVMEVRTQPCSEGHQRCLSFSLDVLPNANIMVYRDFSGNTVHHFDIPGSHSRVKVMAQALVEVQPVPVPQTSEVGSWQDLDDLIAGGDYWEMLLPSHFAHSTPALQRLTSELRVERTGNPLELLLRLNEDLYETFAYVPNSTKVDSPIDDALENRQGVCQDFAHIMIALLRTLRIPSRYVSGYLFHGKEAHDRSPEGATHAWVEVLLPGPGWLGFDPTNNLFASERHIRVAIGRDYADVPPTRGVYKGEAENELSVAVTVSTADAPLPEELPPLTVVRSRIARPSNIEAAQYEQHQQQQQQ